MITRNPDEIEECLEANEVDLNALEMLTQLPPPLSLKQDKIINQIEAIFALPHYLLDSMPHSTMVHLKQIGG